MPPYPGPHISGPHELRPVSAGSGLKVAENDLRRNCDVIDNLEELVLLMLRTSGMRDAVLTYKEEAAVSHAVATTAVKELVRQCTQDHDHSDPCQSAVNTILGLKR